jgi:alkylhydroperoxidase family enzyme
MSPTKHECIADSRDEVERMMSVGESFGAIETMIDEAQLNEEEKAALWLFAWSMRDKREQRRETRGLLAYLSSVPRDFARSGS